MIQVDHNDHRVLNSPSWDGFVGRLNDLAASRSDKIASECAAICARLLHDLYFCGATLSAELSMKDGRFRSSIRYKGEMLLPWPSYKHDEHSLNGEPLATCIRVIEQKLDRLRKDRSMDECSVLRALTYLCTFAARWDKGNVTLQAHAHPLGLTPPQVEVYQ